MREAVLQYTVPGRAVNTVFNILLKTVLKVVENRLILGENSVERRNDADFCLFKTLSPTPSGTLPVENFHRSTPRTATFPARRGGNFLPGRKVPGRGPGGRDRAPMVPAPNKVPALLYGPPCKAGGGGIY